MRVKRKLLVVVLALVAVSSFAESKREVSIGVFGLFHPREFTISAGSSTAVVVHLGEQPVVLEKSSGLSSARVRMLGESIQFMYGRRTVTAKRIALTARDNGAPDFRLAIPGKIARRFRGKTEIRPSGNELLAIVTMDLESAVASIVAAESAPGTPLEALKAQAVATRSYLVASGSRHKEFDFCDTTHCQFLRDLPPANSEVARAAAETAGLALAFKAGPFAAMYSRSCSGRTRTPAELALSDSIYFYYPVECAYCRERPMRWSAEISARDAIQLHRNDEASRLEVNRRLGWKTIRSDDFEIKKSGSHYVVNGTGEGHGIGLCQSGAAAMARGGAAFGEILEHYYPNTSVISLQK